MGKRLTLALIASFFALSSAAMFMWRAQGTHAITGDEPHYLVIADGLLPTFELEQTGPYSREFRNRTISPSGLAPVDAVPGPENTHAERGPRGLFNVHNIGLPLLLSVPYLFGGEIAARLTMIAFGAMIVWFLARILALTSLSPRLQFLVAAPLSFALPFVSGATQIYPDLPAGAVCAAALYGLLRDRRERWWDLLPTTAAVAFLPWLHIRYGLPMLVLVGALSLRERPCSCLRSIVLRFWLIPAASVMILAVYNTYAFGQPTGPYSGGDLMLNRIALMQFLGLFIDQNQGILVQQPLHLVGLYYGWRLFKASRLTTAAVTGVVLTVTIPNSTHWNLYGGWSFSGRFGWTAATALTVLTALAMAHLWESHRRSFFIAAWFGVLVQVRHLSAIFVQKRTLYPHIFDGWIGTYSTFWRPIEEVLPHFRDSRWAFSFVPNLVLLAFVMSIFVIGSATTVAASTRRKGVVVCAAISLGVLGLFGRFGDLPYPLQRWAASSLPSHTGTIDGLSRSANERSDPGLVTYGPYWEVPPGSYEVTVRYSSAGSTTGNAALDVYLPKSGDILLDSPLPATNGVAEEVYFPVSVDETNWGKMEIRTRYSGEGSMKVEWIQLRRVSDNTAE